MKIQEVGQYLQIEALDLHSKGSDADIFARSAYNRYYYATFLIARNCVVSLDKSWAKLPHKAYPELINGQIVAKIIKGRKTAIKISDTKVIHLCQQALSAAKSLSELMKVSSSLRVTADYFPEEKIQFEVGKRFKLKDVDITVAHEWPNKARAFSFSIDAAWRRI